jgi:hypothetical protein
MFSNQSEKTKSAILQSIEIAHAAPQIIVHRISRMALAGPMPSMRDRKEFQLMGAEKLAAMVESWNAMALATGLVIQTTAIQYMVSMMVSTPFTLIALRPTASELRAASPCILSEGIAPIHRRVMANARRLGRVGKHF